jgi:hypothetical protein
MVQLIDPIPVAVIGSSKSDPKSVAYASAFDVGFGIAKRGYAVWSARGNGGSRPRAVGGLAVSVSGFSRISMVSLTSIVPWLSRPISVVRTIQYHRTSAEIASLCALLCVFLRSAAKLALQTSFALHGKEVSMFSASQGRRRHHRRATHAR